MLALSLSDKFCCFGIFVFNFFVFNRFLFFSFSFRFSFHHFFVLVFVNEFVIFSFFTIFVFVNENHTVSEEWLKIEVKLVLSANRKSYMPHSLAQQWMTLSDLE